jgi:hypothetical protein
MKSSGIEGWHSFVSTNFGNSPEDDLRKLKLPVLGEKNTVWRQLADSQEWRRQLA